MARTEQQKAMDDIVSMIDLILAPSAEENMESEENYKERAVLRLIRDRLKEIAG